MKRRDFVTLLIGAPIAAKILPELSATEPEIVPGLAEHLQGAQFVQNIKPVGLQIPFRQCPWMEDDVIYIIPREEDRMFEYLDPKNSQLFSG
jgi:hypothetical protein